MVSSFLIIVYELLYALLQIVCSIFTLCKRGRQVLAGSQISFLSLFLAFHISTIFYGETNCDGLELLVILNP